MIEITKASEISINAHYTLAQEVETTLMPVLEKLKQSSHNPERISRLLMILESNLQHLVQAYGSPASLNTTYWRLSPVEKLVASLVRQGLSSKEIAEALAIAPGTVSIHRKHIRKKLGLDYKHLNLQHYLQTLAESSI